MMLRTRIFAVSFSVSVALLGGAAVALAAFSPRGDEAALGTLSESVDELLAISRAASEGRPVDAEAMRAALSPIRRDVARRAVLERDSAVASAAGWSLFLGAEALAAIAVSAAAAAALTARWSRLRDGILRMRRGGAAEPFFSGTRDEFGAVEEELDGLVAALGDRERMRSELRALQGWGEASAFLAHQARTPLAALSLSASAARAAIEAAPANPGSMDQAKEALSRAESEAARLASLFSRVRSLSGFKDPELVDLDPADAFEEAIATLGARGRGAGPRNASVGRSGSGPRPRFDRAYLVEAFVNLLSNSLEACEERGLPFSARLVLESGPLSYTVEYTDSVTGLGPETAARVGTPRYTTKPDGSGLGVWLVGRVAALHGGRLEIGMTDRGGLRFSMIFPLEDGSRG
ncbi:MAG: HAMP domain-containing histidine kinase [Spirochaetes bacterium]|nr:HAMP domain-containing histidine kinase [Spirochaetota bacterium]